MKFLMIFLHLNTLLCLPLMFLFKKKWKFLIQYFFFQTFGSLMLEASLCLNTYYFFFFFFGLFLKLGVLPLIWWFPNFLKKKNE